MSAPLHARNRGLAGLRPGGCAGQRHGQHAGAAHGLQGAPAVHGRDELRARECPGGLHADPADHGELQRPHSEGIGCPGSSAGRGAEAAPAVARPGWRRLRGRRSGKGRGWGGRVVALCPATGRADHLFAGDARRPARCQRPDAAQCRQFPAVHPDGGVAAAGQVRSGPLRDCRALCRGTGWPGPAAPDGAACGGRSGRAGPSAGAGCDPPRDTPGAGRCPAAAQPAAGPGRRRDHPLAAAGQPLR